AGLAVNKTATVTSNNTQTDVYSFVGDVINYTINVINTGNVTINNIIVKDPLTGLDTTNQSFSLLPGENKEFTQSLTVTLADLNNESITNIATASGLTPNNNPVEAEDTVIVERAGVLGCGTIEVHNAFTPNGDGTNDNFVIDNITDTTCYPENTVEIYNRWGILVYETKGYDNVNNAFKGYSEGRVTVDKSTGLPAGTYFYILNYTAVGLQGEIIPKREQGYLYLTR
ncbi:gliding motility-associated C-terminal domain-containing protein, partial [Flavobacterium flevense]